MAEGKQYEQFPSSGAGNPMSVVMPFLYQIVGTSLAFAIQKFGGEAKLRAAGISVDADTTRIALAIGIAFAFSILSTLVNVARVDYDVPWPYLMLNRGDKGAIEYNAVQRAHGNFLEALVIVGPLVLSTAHLAPAVIFVTSQSWLFGKFMMSVAYASGPDIKKRAFWAWSYLPYYILHGYAWLFLATKLGVIANMF